ncbi:hypothetical protein T492DRAFT_32964 [Pavlovales sp. CCMP2436]|nr:hypothetical protein T492DRAFT_32964 [Pavlovales sp. CCMP2436]
MRAASYAAAAARAIAANVAARTGLTVIAQPVVTGSYSISLPPSPPPPMPPPVTSSDSDSGTGNGSKGHARKFVFASVLLPFAQTPAGIGVIAACCAIFCCAMFVLLRQRSLNIRRKERTQVEIGGGPAEEIQTDVKSGADSRGDSGRGGLRAGAAVDPATTRIMRGG